MLLRSIAVQFQNPEEGNFHNKRVMVQFLNEIAALGYHLFSLTEQQEAFALWLGRPQMDETSMGRPPLDVLDLSIIGISAVAYDDMETYIKTRASTLAITGFSTAQNSSPLSGFKLAILFTGTMSYINITPMTIAFASNKAESEEVFAHWLALFQAMYSVWHPMYARSSAHEADWPEVTDEDIQNAHIPYLYDINFFGPQLVKKPGRERLLSTPAWKVQSLEDGGVLIVPEFIFAQHNPSLWQASVQHLDMDQFFRGKYRPGRQ